MFDALLRHRIIYVNHYIGVHVKVCVIWAFNNLTESFFREREYNLSALIRNYFLSYKAYNLHALS